MLTFRGKTLWGHRDWNTIIESYVRDKKVRFIAYRCDPCPATGAPSYRVYCVFASQVRFGTVVKLFPASKCVPVQGRLSHDLEYFSKQTSFIKLGIEPAQGKRKDMGDAVGGIKRKKRKMSENESAQGLESEFETVDSLLKNLKREYDISSTKKERILDDVKKQLETSKKETKEAEKISADLRTQLETSREETNDFKTQLNIAAPAIVDQSRQAFVLDCQARGAVGYYISTARILENIYAFQPPLRKEDKLVIQKNDCESIRKALKSARLHYHPDRQCKGGYWCRTICMEITKLLNYINEEACQPFAWR
jgi:hypothetical protein